jgi:hypothetical protein
MGLGLLSIRTEPCLSYSKSKAFLWNQTSHEWKRPGLLGFGLLWNFQRTLPGSCQNWDAIPFPLKATYVNHSRHLEQEFPMLRTFSISIPAWNISSKLKIFCVPTPKILLVTVPTGRSDDLYVFL